ncbi:MAG: MBL fold metallo-hydrolase, partial [Acidimicrobiales bacterium]
FDQLRGSWTLDTIDEGTTKIEGWTVTAAEIPHKGGTTFGYRVEGNGSSMAYMPDHWPFAFGPGPVGHGVYHDAALALADGVDLLLHDSQYTAEEFAERADYGHSTVDYAVGLAELANVGELVLFHHDPWRTDDEVDHIVATKRCARVKVSAAVEGTTRQI